ncbi:hypothetical protein BU17DRAFT_61731 [Hysterangium stoloniferum]|nr:hypothetical protein BU17DRAFT_61731 [Hysterangium stoloniferum]
MLTSSFAENSNTASLLKYCYANWVLFKDHDDPRASVNCPGEGWSAWSGGEWDWMSFNKPADDTSVSIGRLRWSISPDQAFKASRISTPNIVMLLRDSNATVQSNGELPLVKLSEQGTVPHNGMGSK